MDTTNIRKKIQYITVDSEFVQGSNNVFTVNLGTRNASSNVTSNILLQNMRNVIGLKLVDFYVTQIGSNETTSTFYLNNSSYPSDNIVPDNSALLLTAPANNTSPQTKISYAFSGSTDHSAHLLGTFTTNTNVIPDNLVIPSGVWKFNAYTQCNTAQNIYMWYKIYYVNGGTPYLIADGSTNQVLISSTTAVTLTSFSLYVPQTTAISTLDEIQIEVYFQQPTGGTGGNTLDLFFNDTTISNLITTLTQPTEQSAVKYIDVLCLDLPDAAQILDERKSKIFARIPLERDFQNGNGLIVNDKQWKSFNRLTNYFNPISIRQLNFQLWELTGTATAGTPGTYQLLQPDATFYMILEVTTIDNDVITLPEEDPTAKVVEAIQSLEEKVVGLPEAMKSFEEKFTFLFEQFPETLKSAFPPSLPPLALPISEQVITPKIDKKMYWIAIIAIFIIVYLVFNKK